MRTPIVAVTGGDGVMARALRALVPEWFYFNRVALDVTDPARVARVLDSVMPDVVVHAAAITDHQHPDAGDLMRVNVLGTEHVARWCRSTGARLVYLSTHYVYGGEAPPEGYREHDACAPIGAYAWSKFLGEHVVETLVPNRLIVRGSWYDWDTRVRAWVHNGALTDAWHTREPVGDAARKIAQLVDAGVQGVVNIGGPQRTFYDVAAAEAAARGLAAPEPFRRLQLHRAPYAFPRDTSVCTARFDALQLPITP